MSSVFRYRDYKKSCLGVAVLACLLKYANLRINFGGESVEICDEVETEDNAPQRGGGL